MTDKKRKKTTSNSESDQESSSSSEDEDNKDKKLKKVGHSVVMSLYSLTISSFLKFLQSCQLLKTCEYFVII